MENEDFNINDIMASWAAQFDQVASGFGHFARLIASYRDALLDLGFSVEAAENMTIDYHAVLVAGSLNTRQQDEE